MKHIDVVYSFHNEEKIGDKIILTEFPENLHNVGYNFINKHNNPFLKYNPYVGNNKSATTVDFREIDYNFIHNAKHIDSRSDLLFEYLNLDRFKITLKKPKLYIYENNKKENIILIHTTSKGLTIPDWIIEHVYSKYNKNFRIIQIVPPNEERIPNVEYKDFDFYNDPWEEVAEIASKSIMFIGVDSWVSHMAQAYIPNINILITSFFIKQFNNNSRPFSTGGTIGNIWLHPNNYYFNESNRSISFTNSYLTL